MSRNGSVLSAGPKGGYARGRVKSGPLVSVVVLTYRRPVHLRRTLESFLRVNTYPNLELVLADDGSPPDLQEEMRRLPFDRFLLPAENRGLGANTNAGLRAATGEYILQLQDDWLCEGPSGFIEAAIDVMTERPEIGMVRLRVPQPGLRSTTWTSRGGLSVRVFDSPPASRRDFIYTDTPHIKSQAFVEFMGDYLESRYMQKTELDMRDRFNAQSRYRAAVIEGHQPFEHIGDDASFNRPPPLARLSAAFERVPGLRGAVRLYRRVKGRLGR
jgi:glycosyltransferase involved in cell wall biosynthesis